MASVLIPLILFYKDRLTYGIKYMFILVKVELNFMMRPLFTFKYHLQLSYGGL